MNPPEPGKPCPWEYPFGHAIGRALCGAPARWAVVYSFDGRREAYCLNHAQREVMGGQARWDGPADRDARTGVQTP